MTLLTARRLAAVLLVTGLATAACGGDDGDGAEESQNVAQSSGDERADWPDSITFASIPAQEGGSREEMAQPYIRALEHELGIEVDFVTATDYAGVIEAQIAGDVEIAHYGPFSYVIAGNNGADIEPVVAVIPEPGGEPGYVSYGLTRAGDTEINSIDDFGGRDVCFVDSSSTSGFLYPAAGLLDVDIDPEDDLNPVYTGGHDASVTALIAGDCDAAFAYDEMVDSIMPSQGQLEDGQVEVVWESSVIPSTPIAVLSGLPDSLKEAIQEVFVTYDGDELVERGWCEENWVEEDGPNGVASCVTFEGNWGYVEIEDGWYDDIRDVCELTEAPACDEA